MFGAVAMNFSMLMKAGSVAASALVLTLAVAGDGHHHGEAKPTASGPALPRFTAQSELFEAVGTLRSDELSVLIDRTASNEPVLDATVELQSGGVKLTGKFHADHGDYSFDAKAFAKAGTYPITLTIKAGADSDLLTGELDVHEATNPLGANTAAHTHGWQHLAVWGGGGLAMLLLALFGLRRLIANRRNQRNRLGVAA
jgi:hypothetical protein